MPSQTRNRNSAFQRSGVSLVMVALTAPVLLGAVVLAVDVGNMAFTRTETQNAADAAALAGVSALPERDIAVVEARVQEYLDKNLSGTSAASYSADVEIGEWDADARSFSVLTSADIRKADAVRVVVTQNESPFHFARLLGATSFNVSREAIAQLEPFSNCRLWGLEGAALKGGSITDSYDSTAGAYNAGSAGMEGNVCSCQNVDLNGSKSTVYGDALHGDGYIVDLGPSTVVGDIYEIPECIDPVADFGDIATNNDNDSIGTTTGGNDPLPSGSNFSIGSGDSITLAAGRYYFDSFYMGPNSTLTVTGFTKIFVSGSVEVQGGGTVNATQDPWDLSMICSTADPIAWTSDVDFYGSMLAPNAKFKISGHADFYGVVIARVLESAGQSSFHADESMPIDDLRAPPPKLVK